MFKDDMIIVAEAEESSKPDHLGGFFASVVLALLVCTFGVSAIRWVLAMFDVALSPQVAYDLAAALFVGLLMADPFGTFLNRMQARRAVSRFILGFGFGWGLQHFVVTPIAGGGVSMFVFLALSLILLPLMLAMNALERVLDSRGIVLGEEVSRGIVRVLRMPRVVPAALAAVLVLQALWWIRPDAPTTGLLMGIALLFAFLPPLTVPIYDPDPDSSDVAETGPAFTRYSALALHEVFLFAKWHFGPILYFSSVVWLVNGVLPHVSQWQRLQSFVESLVQKSFLGQAALTLLVLGLALGAGLLLCRLVMAALGKLLRWPEGDSALRFGLVRNILLFRG